MKDNDEYKLREVLISCGAFTPKTLEAINEHLDKTLTGYLDNKAEQEAAFATEATCYLQMALISTFKERPVNKYKFLSGRIKDIVKGYNTLIEEVENKEKYYDR